MIRKFIAHTSPGKSRIFALTSGTPDYLEAVTSLGADDLHLTDKLVIELNDFLARRDESDLGSVLEAVPNPVRMAVNQFLKDRCPTARRMQYLRAAGRSARGVFRRRR